MTKEILIWLSLAVFWIVLFLAVPAFTYNEPERVTATCITAYLSSNNNEGHILCGEIYDAT